MSEGREVEVEVRRIAYRCATDRCHETSRQYYCTTSELAGLLLEARRHAKTERHGEARHISALRSRDGDGSEGIVLVSQWRSVSPLLLSLGVYVVPSSPACE